MRVETVAVGTELLLGQIVDTNAQWMAQRLAEIGVDVVHHQAVGDNLERIVETLHLASTRAELLRRTGREAEAKAAYEEALAFTSNAVEADFLVRRLTPGA